jgi:hypothetical protein
MVSGSGPFRVSVPVRSEMVIFGANALRKRGTFRVIVTVSVLFLDGQGVAWIMDSSVIRGL